MDKNSKPTVEDKLESFLQEYDVHLIGAFLLAGIALWVVEKLILHG